MSAVTGAATRTARAVVLGAVVVLTAACTVSGGGDGGGDGGGEGGDGGQAAPVPDQPAGDVPASWEAHQVEGLTFALPDFMRSSDDLIPGTTETLRAVEGEGEVPAAAGVFVETGDVAPLDVRADVVRQVRVAQLGEDPVGEPRVLEVAGAEAAVVFLWEWDYDFPGGPTVPSRQVEVVIASEGTPQYGLLVGGPAEVVTEEVVEDLLASLAVSPADEA